MRAAQALRVASADGRDAALSGRRGFRRRGISRRREQLAQHATAAATGDSTSAASSDRPVLSDVTWLIGAGDRYGLLGENGAGKTTLLNIIQGKLKPLRRPRENRL